MNMGSQLELFRVSQPYDRSHRQTRPYCSCNSRRIRIRCCEAKPGCNIKSQSQYVTIFVCHWDGNGNNKSTPLYPHQKRWNSILIYHYCLVVTGTMEFYDFPFSWEFHHPNWQTHIFQRGWLNHQPENYLCWLEGFLVERARLDFLKTQ